jgi:exodeoxyribonuclease III
MTSVRVMTMNVNGLRAALRKGLEATLRELAPDLLCVQEVRAMPHQVAPLDGFAAAYWHPAERPGYSGVASLARQAVDEVTTGIGVPEHDAEGRVQRLDVGSLSVVNVYVPSGTTGDARQAVKMSFLNRFRDYLTALLRKRDEVLVCGDVNIAHREIDLKNWRANRQTSGFLPEERAFFGSLLELGLRDVVRDLAGPDTAVYTWWSSRAGARAKDVGWRLDYHLATSGLAARARAYQVLRTPLLSDHAPVVVDYELEARP